MKATTSIETTANINVKHNPVNAAEQASQKHGGAIDGGQGRGKPESELRAAARRKGLTLKELADLMSVSYGYLSSVASGRRPWSPMLRERATEILGEVPGQGVVYRQGGLVQGESTCIRERARERGLSMKALAGLVGVSAGYLSEVSRGRKNMSPAVQARVDAALGGPVEIAPAQCANRRGGVVAGGESTYLRERARERGMTLRQVAERAGLSYGHVVMVSRGQRNLSPAAQVRMEAVLDAPVKVESAQSSDVDPAVLWERMDAHGWSQNETARRAGISSAMLSQVMNGQRKASGPVLEKLHGVLFAPSAAELVAPVELKVMGWKKGGRNGVVIQGAGGPRSNGKPGDSTIRTGGRVPWGAEVEFAYTTGYDSRGRVSVHHLVDERGYSALLKRSEPEGVQRRRPRSNSLPPAKGDGKLSSSQRAGRPGIPAGHGGRGLSGRTNRGGPLI